MICYEHLFSILDRRSISLNTLSKEAGVNWRTISNMQKGMPVSLTTIEKICIYLDVPIEKVVTIKRR